MDEMLNINICTIRNTNLGEVILQFTPAEVLEDFLPVWWSFETTQVWFQLPSKNFEGSRFPNPICSNKTKDLPRTRHR